MGVLYDAGSEYQRSISAATVTLTHTGTVANVAGVAVAFVKGGGTQPTITNVSYGGVTLLQIARATDTATEPGAAEIWYAGSGVPSGVRAVIYNTTTIASNVHVVITTWTSPHSTYAIGSGTKSQNTASISVSLTTGYVSGYALGAFYGGGAEPATFTYATDRTLIHDWDMGAFYSEVFRQTNATAAGTGPLQKFGGDPKANDDVAFAAIFITDGSIDAGRGQVNAAGLAPTILGEAVAAAPVGLVASGTLAPAVTGLIQPDVGYVKQNFDITGPVIYYDPLPLNTHEPVVMGCVFPGVGYAATVGQQPTVSGSSEVTGTATPDVGLVTTVGQIPGEYRELNQGIGLGALVTSGQAPQSLRDGSIGPLQGLCLAGGIAPTLYTELAQNIGLGSAVIAGLAPSDYRELSQSVGLGSAVIGGLGPACLPENGIGPAQGLCSLGGLAPSLYLERLITPEVVPVAVIEGRAPVVDTGGLVVEATITPDTALLTLDGRTPDEQVEYDKPRGHVTVRRRHRRNYGFELSAMPEAVVTTVAPVPAAALETPEIVDPPSEPIAALDTVAAEARIKTLETRRSRAARMRREEEELIAILIRAA